LVADTADTKTTSGSTTRCRMFVIIFFTWIIFRIEDTDNDVLLDMR
jgi:hypothetical protein